MYSPKHHREEDRRKILDFIHQNEFATLVAYDGEKPVASHLLLELVEDGETILINGHMSKANSLWKLFEKNQEVLIIFQGPHTYVSATWYDHLNVPTWNYQSVHAYGRPRLVTGYGETHGILSRLIQKHDPGSSYRLESLPQDFVQAHINGIMAFQVEVTRLEAAFKLSQNRDDNNYRNVIAELEKREDGSSHAVAQAMRRNRP